MLPLIPLAVAATSAAILVRKKILSSLKKSRHQKLLAYLKLKLIPVDNDGNFDPNTMLPTGYPLLFDVIYSRELLTSLLECGANPNLCSPDGVPVLIHALRCNRNEEDIALLLKYGSDPNAMDSNGKTALFYTASPRIQSLLLKAGADANAVDDTGKTALFYLLNNNFKHLALAAKELIKAGCDVNARDCDGKTALFYALSDLSFAILKDAGADFNVVDNTGKTPVFYSLTNYSTATLVKYGARINARDTDGKNVVFYAKNEYELAALAAAGADFNVIDNTGKSPLFYADNNAFIRALVRHGASPKVKDSEGNTILFYLSDPCDFPLVSFLVDNGLDINAVNANGEKYKYYDFYQSYCQRQSGNISFDAELYEAVNNDDIGRARRALREGASRDVRDTTVKSWNMIHLAIYRNNPHMIEVLVKEGVDINGCGSYVNSPLRKAVYDHKYDCVKKLLELGANPELARSALDDSVPDDIKRLFAIAWNK